MTQTPPSPATPPAGNTGDPQPQAGDPTPTPTPQAGAVKTPEDYERMLSELRRENAGHRTKLKSFEEAEAARQAAQMTELEKAQKAATDAAEQQELLAAELFEARVFQDVVKLAPKFNFLVSADTLARMLLLDDEAIEFEDGKPTNIEKLLEKLAKAEPNLVKSQQQQEQQQQGVPNLPAMSPGRSSIQPPGAGTPGKIPSLTDPSIWKR